MKIVNNSYKVCFGDLSAGDVFAAGNEYYLKIEEIEEVGGYFFSAINLHQCNHVWFEDSAEVMLVNCELVIK